MGVWGLLSFVQMANPPIGQQISLSGTTTQNMTASGKGDVPVIIIDGYALAHHLFMKCEECCWWDGGELRDYSQSVRDWVRQIQGCGVRLRCVLDGMMEPRKEGTALQRVSGFIEFQTD